MNPDSKIMNFLGRLGDMFILNILYLLCCVPVVTIGAATTGLYYTTLKMAENRESYVWKDFLKSFRQNFRQATVIWLILLAALAVLAMDFLLGGGLAPAVGSVVAVGGIVAAVFLVLEIVYVFPVLARFENSVLGTMRNALIMAIRHLPRTVVILVIHGLPLLLAFASIQAFVRGVWVVLLFTVSVLAYIESRLFSKIFPKYYPKEIDLADGTR